MYNNSRVAKHNKKITNGLIAMSSAAVLAVYAAGYERTRSAADQVEQQSEQRHPVQAGRGPGAVSMGAQPEMGEMALPAAVKPSAETAAHLSQPTGEPSGPQPQAVEEAKNATVQFPVESPASVESAPASPTSPIPAGPAPTGSAAPAPVTAPAVTAAPEPSTATSAKWKDGTYLGWGSCRHGDIQAQVVIEGGRITSAKVATCMTRYSCSVISKLPPEVVQRQSPETDFVSGATQSTNAFYYAVVEALNQAAVDHPATVAASAK